MTMPKKMYFSDVTAGGYVWHKAFPTLPEFHPERYKPYIRADAPELVALVDVLEWYGEQARLCRLIHSEGDAGRLALAADGGGRARAALDAFEAMRDDH